MSRPHPSAFRVGLLGEGIAASLTPPMHEREARALGLDYRYELFDIAADTFDAAELEAFVRGLRAAGFTGLNVTHPYKQRILDLVDEVTPDAARIGAANLIQFVGDRVVGHNTDWSGFASSLAAALPAGPTGRVLQVGSGGAGAATAYSLLSSGVRELVILDLDVARATDLVDRYRDLFPDRELSVAGSSDDVDWAGLGGVVHATPLGMDHHPGQAFDPARLAPTAWLAEVVYRPTRTRLVEAAEQHGLTVVDGTGMAAGQAIDTLRILTGLEPDAGRVMTHLRELLAQEARSATPTPTDSGAPATHG